MAKRIRKSAGRVPVPDGSKAGLNPVGKTILYTYLFKDQGNRFQIIDSKELLTLGSLLPFLDAVRHLQVDKNALREVQRIEKTGRNSYEVVEALF